MCLAVLDLGFTGIHSPLFISPCSDDLKIRCQSLDTKLKTDLIITLSGSAVADCSSALLTCNFHQLLGDQRSCHGSSKEIFVLIYGMSLYTGNDIFITKFIDNIEDV